MFFLFRFPPASLPEDLQANSVNPVLEPWDEVVSEPIDEQDQALEAPHEVRDIEVIKGASVALPTEPVARPHKLVTPRPAATPLKKSQRSVTTGTDASVNGQATLQVFGNEARGNKFVFLFDRSISMEGSPLSTAKSQLVANLALLKNSHAFQIVFLAMSQRLGIRRPGAVLLAGHGSSMPPKSTSCRLKNLYRELRRAEALTGVRPWPKHCKCVPTSFFFLPMPTPPWPAAMCSKRCDLHGTSTPRSTPSNLALCPFRPARIFWWSWHVAPRDAMSTSTQAT